MDFATILRHGRKKFQTKHNKYVWGVCEYCEERKQIFEYKDNKKEIWHLCEKCIDFFIEEEE